MLNLAVHKQIMMDNVNQGYKLIFSFFRRHFMGCVCVWYLSRSHSKHRQFIEFLSGWYSIDGYRLIFSIEIANSLII